MAMHLARLRFALGALAVLLLVGLAAPVSAQQPTSVNPTASSVTEQKLFEQMKRIQGRGSIPDTRSYTIEQPAGRDWRQFHEVTLVWIGAVAIFGIIIVLALYQIIHGPIMIEEGRSGRTILRFNGFERFTHWVVGTTFIILGLTGLNFTYGKRLILPLIGPENFTTLSEWAKYAHNFLSFPFVLGVLTLLVIWVRENLPTRADIEWLKQGGGMFKKAHPPAWKFNAGQKILFWIVVLATILIAVPGYLLIFPFYVGNIAWMQVSEIVHSVGAMLFIAVILAHIYIGTLGMEGGFEAMGTGNVDLNWAKEHHSLWLAQEQARAGTPQSTPPAGGRMQPAE